MKVGVLWEYVYIVILIYNAYIWQTNLMCIGFIQNVDMYIDRRRSTDADREPYIMHRHIQHHHQCSALKSLASTSEACCQSFAQFTLLGDYLHS